MFRKVIVFGLFEMIKKKKNEDHVPWSGFGLRVGSGIAERAVIDIFKSPDMAIVLLASKKPKYGCCIVGILKSPYMVVVLLENKKSRHGCCPTCISKSQIWLLSY